jgi:hypothetical protein
MAAGSASVSVTLNAVNAGQDSNNIERQFVVAALLQAAQAIGSNLALTSGNIVVSANTPGPPTTVGSWTFTAST